MLPLPFQNMTLSITPLTNFLGRKILEERAPGTLDAAEDAKLTTVPKPSAWRAAKRCASA
jgi:hypothetical protein